MAAYQEKLPLERSREQADKNKTKTKKTQLIPAKLETKVLGRGAHFSSR